MPFNGSGTFSRVHNWASDRDGGININADRMDAEFDGIATALSLCILKDGQQDPTANLPMNSKVHTGVGNATARSQYAAAGQTQDGEITWLTDVGTSANVVSAVPLLPLSAFATGQKVRWRQIGTPASSPLRLNVGFGNVSMDKGEGTVLSSGDLVSGVLYEGTYDPVRARLYTVPVYFQDPDLTALVSAGAVSAINQSGRIVQTVTTAITTWFGNSALYALGSNPPSTSSGQEIATVSIVPTRASSKLLCRFSGFGSTSGASNLTTAIFKDATTSAFALSIQAFPSQNTPQDFNIEAGVSAATTSAVTIKVRQGVNTSVFYINGFTTTKLGGTAAKATLVVEEIAP